MTNSRPPPDALMKTQLSQVSSWCRYDPLVCVGQVAVETAFVATAYCAVFYVTGGRVPDLKSLALFFAMFMVLGIAARMISDDLGNKLSITATSGIGSKLVSLLAPRFVSW